MKKAILIVLLCSASKFMYSCVGNHTESETGTHTHSDGSTHGDHDTSKPAQEIFKVADSAKVDTTSHTHDNGETYSH